MKISSLYYSFGSAMSGRTFSSSTYRYGFNGKENDLETELQDYGMRIYNLSLGRFLSIDPIANEFSELTPYQFASNRVISHSDLDGKEGWEEIVAVYAIYEWLFATTAVVTTSVVIHEKTKDKSNSSGNNTDSPIANPWDVEITPTPTYTATTEQPTYYPNPKGGKDPLKPELPDGGSNLGGSKKYIIGTVLAARIIKWVTELNGEPTEASQPNNEKKTNSPNVKKNNSTNTKNNGSSTPSANTNAPKTNTQQIEVSKENGGNKMEKISDVINYLKKKEPPPTRKSSTDTNKPNQ